MTELNDALAQLDEVRARHQLAPLPPGLPEAQVRELLNTAGVHPHDHLVTWYTHYGASPGSLRLVPGIFVTDLAMEVKTYLDMCAVAQDWRADPIGYSESVDWFTIGKEFVRTVVWARECPGDPAVAGQNGLFELDPPPTGDPVTLPELVRAWATRLDLGWYTPAEDGTIPWFKGDLPDDVLRRTGL